MRKNYNHVGNLVSTRNELVDALAEPFIVYHTCGDIETLKEVYQIINEFASDKTLFGIRSITNTINYIHAYVNEANADTKTEDEMSDEFKHATRRNNILNERIDTSLANYKVIVLKKDYYHGNNPKPFDITIGFINMKLVDLKYDKLYYLGEEIKVIPWDSAKHDSKLRCNKCCEKLPRNKMLKKHPNIKAFSNTCEKCGCTHYYLCNSNLSELTSAKTFEIIM